MSEGLQGGDELVSKLKALGDKLGSSLLAAVMTGALPIQNDAKVKAPFKTGNLKRSIHSEEGEKTSDSVTVNIGTDVIYARTQEYGGGDERDYIPAHPYLRPAYDEKKDKAVKEIKNALADIVRSAV